MIATVRSHLARAWGIAPTEIYWQEAAAQELPKGFCILRFAPAGARTEWIYATCGLSLPSLKEPIEIYWPRPAQEDRAVELLTTLAHRLRAERDSPPAPGELSAPADAPQLLSTDGHKVRFLRWRG